MRIEAFSRGKDPADAGANEDQFLVLPGLGYAVIDGVSDIEGRRYDGRRAGLVASRVVQQAVRDSSWIRPRRGEARAADRRTSRRSCGPPARAYGMPGAARGEPGGRFAATLTLAVDLGRRSASS